MSETVTRADIERAIAICEEGRDSHAQWAAYIRDNPDSALEPVPRVETAGSVEWQETWVANYDHVLRVLRAMTGGEA